MHAGQRLLYFAFIVLFASTLYCSVPPSSAAQLPATAEETTPLKTGDDAPEFTVQTVDNDDFHFEPDALQKPTMLISFRGGWCPYCNLHLSELRTVVPEIRGLGLDVLFISNDSPELLYSSLELDTQEDIDGLDYIILSDAKLQAAVAFGTAFRISDKVIPYLNRKGKDYRDSSIDRHNALAVPAVYVIGTDGKIAYDFVNANYKVRLPADELLAVARRLGSAAN